MNNLKKSERIIRYASEHKNLNIRRSSQKQNQNVDAFKLMINRLYRKGIINYTLEGNRVQLGLTQAGYYGRALFVK